MKQQLSPYVRTLASGVHASAGTETFDVDTKNQAGLIVMSSVSEIAPPPPPDPVYGLLVTYTPGGFGMNGTPWEPGPTDALAQLGIAAGQVFVGAVTQGGPIPSLPLTVVSHVNDTFYIANNIGPFRMTPGTYSTADVLATAMANAVCEFAGVFNGRLLKNLLGAGSFSVAAVVVGSNAPPAASQTVRVLGVDEASDGEWLILEAAPQTAAGTQVLEVGRNLPIDAGRSAVALLPRTVRIEVAHSTDDPITRSIGCQLVP